MERDMAYVSAECEACDGTGVFKSILDGGKTGRVCEDCDGSGHITLSYIPFTGRKKRSDVDKVISVEYDGLKIAAKSKPISYKDFLDWKMPKLPNRKAKK